MARERRNALGSYLQARRAQITPQSAGIPPTGHRRVPGLRREEVALLAGISVDYYLRLERGRDRNPSPQVLEALARVLQLDDEHRAHVASLAQGSPRGSDRVHETPSPAAGLITLVDTMSQPAFLEDGASDIVASNAAARALSPRLAPGGNQLRDVFLDPEEHALFPDWHDVTVCLVTGLRRAAPHALEDQRLGALVAELLQHSARFRELWARHDVRGQHGAPVRVDHPMAGLMTLHRERLAITGSEGLTLVILHAEPGSPDADRLSLLGREPAAVASR
ncbi:transcriptional regulator [Microbacterium faecale]|uniref:Transcriptional regulator n=1 Tax=Microbacterium faecale TaxID=1804630 RepID=A0A916Y2A2_9MICO|nr:transcriptional regulator [Microbacterium faecale]